MRPEDPRPARRHRTLSGSGHGGRNPVGIWSEIARKGSRFTTEYPRFVPKSIFSLAGRPRLREHLLVPRLVLLMPDLNAAGRSATIRRAPVRAVVSMWRATHGSGAKAGAGKLDPGSAPAASPALRDRGVCLTARFPSGVPKPATTAMRGCGGASRTPARSSAAGGGPARRSQRRNPTTVARGGCGRIPATGCRTRGSAAPTI